MAYYPIRGPVCDIDRYIMVKNIRKYCLYVKIGEV
jgi:hypothetical protein